MLLLHILFSRMYEERLKLKVKELNIQLGEVQREKFLLEGRVRRLEEADAQHIKNNHNIGNLLYKYIRENREFDETKFELSEVTLIKKFLSRIVGEDIQLEGA